MRKIILISLWLTIPVFLFAQTNDTVNNKIVITDKGDYMEMKLGDSVFTISYDAMYSEYLVKGVEKANNEDYSGAISDFNLALLYKISDPQVFYNKGLAFYYLKDYEQAIANYNEATRIDSLYEEVYGQRGIAKSLAGDFAGAEADFITAIHLQPDKGVNHYNYGISLLMNNQNDMACAELKLAESLGYVEAHNFLVQYCR